ncbi:DNA cytosine methyltransferase [Campylobacter canadensis]|nr:DNA cytosine methyltransferase [Campylobacter canadensis]
MLENVKGLLNHDKGQTFQKILELLKSLDYEVSTKLLNRKYC